MRSENMQIRYKNIILRDMIESDIGDNIRWNTTEREWELWDEPWEEDEPFDLAQFRKNEQRDFKILEELKKVNPFRWVLEIDYEDGTHIGTVDTYLLDDNYKRVTRKEIKENQHFSYALGIAIFEPFYWNRGLGTQALTAYIQHHLKNKNMEIYLQTWSGNIRMVKSAIKLGFYICDIQKDIRDVSGSKYDGLTLKLDLDKFQKI